MRVTERIIDNPDAEGVILEYVSLTNDFISVRPALNGRLYAKMENGEEILITRKYAKEIAQYFIEEESDERI